MIQTGSKFKLTTDYPIAVDSPDHLYPFGVAQNNNHSQGFTDKIHTLYPTPMSLLDLGCAGGRNIYEHNKQGDHACGLDGSDYRKVRNLPEWDKETNLLTCDVTKPFTLKTLSETDTKFNAITAWELLEHLKEKDLPQFLDNVKNHLDLKGLFIGSICVFDQAKCDKTKGIEWGPSDEFPDGNLKTGIWDDQPLFYHQNVRPREWWWDYFTKQGFNIRFDLVEFFGKDVVRGPGVGCGIDDSVNFYLEMR